MSLSRAAFLAPALCHPAGRFILQAAAAALIALAAVTALKAAFEYALALGDREFAGHAKKQFLWAAGEILAAALLVWMASAVCS